MLKVLRLDMQNIGGTADNLALVFFLGRFFKEKNDEIPHDKRNMDSLF
jgi:hypothetical protein